jgi:ankyrin repeat protein
MLGDERETALYAACGVSNNAKLAKLLLNAGAEVNDGDASYHVAEFDNCDCIQVLFEHGMDENHRATVLLRKLDFEDADGVRAILRWGADPNAHGVWGKSSLHQAIMRRRSLEVIKALLDAGANPNDLRQDGASVYYLAARYGRPDVVELLHQFGLCPPELTPTEKLVAACGLADESTARQLTEQHSRLINTLNDDQRSAICDCGRSGSTRAIQVMLAVGFDITQQDNQGFTPLHWAAWYGHLECVNMLLERGAPVDITNNYNGEALDSAIWGYANSDGDDRNCRAIITSLVAAGADIERVTPFPSGHAESDALLRELGRSG